MTLGKCNAVVLSLALFLGGGWTNHVCEHGGFDVSAWHVPGVVSGPAVGDGFSGVIYAKSDQPSRNALTPSQHEIVYGTGAGSLYEYMNGHAVKHDGQPLFRVIDPDWDLSKEDPVFQEYAAKTEGKRAPLPFFACSGGKGHGGTSFAITPTMTVQEVIAQAKKFGGP